MKDNFVTCKYCGRMLRIQDAAVYSRLFVKLYFHQPCLRVWAGQSGVKVGK